MNPFWYSIAWALGVLHVFLTIKTFKIRGWCQNPAPAGCFIKFNIKNTKQECQARLYLWSDQGGVRKPSMNGRFNYISVLWRDIFQYLSWELYILTFQSMEIKHFWMFVLCIFWQGRTDTTRKQTKQRWSFIPISLGGCPATQPNWNKALKRSWTPHVTLWHVWLYVYTLWNADKIFV